MRRPLSSVRARATLAATAVVAVALVAAGLAVLLSLRSDLTAQVDRAADEAARGVAVQIAAGRPYKDLELPDGDEHPVQVADEEGRPLVAGEDLERMGGTGLTWVRPVPDPDAGPDRRGDFARHDVERDDDDGDDADDHDDSGSGRDDDGPAVGEIGDDVRHTSGWATVDGHTDDYRFAGVEVTDPGGRTVVVYAGASVAEREDAVRSAATVMLIGLPALLCVVAAVTWLVTRRALRPVEDIRSEMAAITASQDLARRVPEPRTHDEVDRLARTTNETLAALQASVERQRRFVADASHELRSPIASLRTQLEVGAAHPELLDVTGAVADTVRLQQLAADLLLLARLDAGERAGRGRFDLAALAAEESARRGADRVPVTLRARSVEVRGSRRQLSRVLGNLLDNAQRHARSRITVSVRAETGWAVLAVEDDGAGVPRAERERVFERFVRLDDARSRDDGGAGLGLAIARDVAERHGGTLTVRTAATGGARFELRLPR